MVLVTADIFCIHSGFATFSISWARPIKYLLGGFLTVAIIIAAHSTGNLWNIQLQLFTIVKEMYVVVYIHANVHFQYVLTLASFFHVFLAIPGSGRPWDPYRCVLSLRSLTLIRASCLFGVGGVSHRMQKKSFWEKQNYYMLVLTSLFGTCRPSLLWPKWLGSVNTAAKTYKLSG